MAALDTTRRDPVMFDVGSWMGGDLDSHAKVAANFCSIVGAVTVAVSPLFL